MGGWQDCVELDQSGSRFLWHRSKGIGAVFAKPAGQTTLVNARQWARCMVAGISYRHVGCFIGRMGTSQLCDVAPVE